MNPTDSSRLQQFFEERLVPAAEALRRRGVRFFPLGPEPEAQSWYHDAPGGEDFFSIDDAQACANRLHQLWGEDELPELAELVGPLLELGRDLEIAEEETADISPFVYVMY